MTTTISTTAAGLDSSVLILHTFGNNVPILTDIDGNLDSNLQFEVEIDVFVHQSCGVQFQGDFFIYGSRDDDQQIAKVTDCSLNRVATLPFTFSYGACAATTDQVFLCFDSIQDGKTCYTSNEPTNHFKPISKSTEEHKFIRIATNEGKIIYNNDK